MTPTQKNVLLTGALVTTILTYTFHTHCMKYYEMVEKVNKTYQKVCKAAKEDNLQAVEKLLEKNKNLLVNPYVVHNGYKTTPTHIAAKHNSLQVLEFFIKNKEKLEIDLEENTTYVGTPLHCAVKAGNIQSVKLLIEEGDVGNIHNKYLDTPYELAVKHGHENIIEYLEN